MNAKAWAYVVFPDLHLGLDDGNESSIAALECALQSMEYVKSLGFRLTAVILGDWLDGASCSSHGASSVRESLQRGYIETEVDPCRKILDRIQESAEKLVFIEGNHEHRILRWALRSIVSGPLTDIVQSLSPRELLSRTLDGKPRKRFEWVSYVGPMPHYKIAPDLWALHGWSYAKNAAAVHLATARSVSIIHGHTHQRQEVSGRDPNTGRLLFGMSPGCLSTLTPDYRAHSPTAWSHGFAVVYQSRRDPMNWTHYLASIRDGYCVLPDGHEIIVKPRRAGASF